MKKKKIKNPLRAFNLPVNVGTLQTVGDTSNPMSSPFKPNPNITLFTPAGYATVRHPSEDYVTDSDKANLNVVIACNSLFRPGIYQILHVNDWEQFSNHGWPHDPKDDSSTKNYGHFASIEVIHDAVHDAVGDVGHMSQSDIAAFDPIFFFHHANVDRFVAIWQACYPDAWMKNGTNRDGAYLEEPRTHVNELTNLEPFRKGETEYWTSKDVR